MQCAASISRASVGGLMHNQYLSLLRERRFLPLFVTQFFGAFNDNAFKLAMLTIISYRLTSSLSQSEFYQALSGGLFIIPFFVFSSLAGQIADLYEKARLVRYIKLFEMLLMLIGSLGLYLGNIILMMCTLVGMGIHSAFFGPIKYAILPDHLPKTLLLAATGLIEGSTFLAILLGTTLGTISIGMNETIPYIAICMVLLAATLGLIASLFIPDAPPSITDMKVDMNLWRATLLMISHAHQHLGLFLTTVTISWFWLIGAVLLTKLPDYAHYILGADTTIFALFLALFSSGIALGSLLVNYILRGAISLNLVPVTLLLFSCFLFDIFWISPMTGSKAQELLSIQPFFSLFRHWRISFDLLMLGVCAGLFLVPLYTYLQAESQPATRARTIAANNIYNSLFMVLGTLIVIFLLHFNISIPRVFFIFSVLNVGVALIVWVYLRRLA
jgi:MFS family permease